MRVLAREFYKAFKRVNGYAMSAIGVAGAILLYIVLPDSTVPAKILIPVTILVILFVITLFDCALSCAKRMTTQLPRVIRAYPPSAPYSDARAILVLEESAIFAHDSMVSVFTRANDFERFIGIGFVTTVQRNGWIQVCVLPGETDAETEEIWQRIQQGNKDELELLLVKPSIPRFANT